MWPIAGCHLILLVIECIGSILAMGYAVCCMHLSHLDHTSLYLEMTILASVRMDWRYFVVGRGVPSMTYALCRIKVRAFKTSYEE